MAASMRPPPEVESDDEESGDWEEWQAAGAEEDEAAQCFFCREQLPSSKAVFRHCAEVHSFDFLKLRADAHLDFYDTLRVINFIRSKVAETEAWSVGDSLALFGREQVCQRTQSRRERLWLWVHAAAFEEALACLQHLCQTQVRTDAYRDAIVANPALLKNAVVMDVGCGTCILRPGL